MDGCRRLFSPNIISFTVRLSVPHEARTALVQELPTLLALQTGRVPLQVRGHSQDVLCRQRGRGGGGKVVINHWLIKEFRARKFAFIFVPSPKPYLVVYLTATADAQWEPLFFCNETRGIRRYNKSYKNIFCRVSTVGTRGGRGMQGTCDSFGQFDSMHNNKSRKWSAIATGWSMCPVCHLLCRRNDVVGTGDCLETQPRHPVIISQHKETPVAGNLNIYEMIVCAYYNVERHWIN